MIFWTYDLTAENALEKFKSIFLSSVDLLRYEDRLRLCEFQVHLISYGEIIAENLPDDVHLSSLVVTFHKAWQKKPTIEFSMLNEDTDWATICQNSEVVFLSRETENYRFVRRFNSEKYQDHFVIFLTGREIKGLPIYDLLYLGSLWQLEQNALPIHSAGIIHHGGLFLFAGPSGRGKSSVSRMSAEQGDKVLDEDQVVIYQNSSGFFSANAWGYSTDFNSLPIRGYFHLVQSNEDKLEKIPIYILAQFILRSCFEIFGDKINGNQLIKAFNLACDIARTIPGYELHFRKSPDFWKLIDAEFGLD